MNEIILEIQKQHPFELISIMIIKKEKIIKIQNYTTKYEELQKIM
jgi:hypothetical protein